MKKRQHLPLLTKLNYSIDIERLQREFLELGYDDWNLYNGLKADAADSAGLIVRRVLLEYFLNDNELDQRKDLKIVDGGEAYKMLCLTGYNEEKGAKLKKSNNVLDLLENMDPHLLSRKLEKICDPTHELYVPEADEKNYDLRNSFCQGYINEIIDFVEEHIGHVSRTRFAVLMPGEKIKPHMDINTDKAIRIHIPLFTDTQCIVGVQGKKRKVEVHMPADGHLWFLNQGYSHWVNNDSSIPRVHMVFSVIGQDNIVENAKEIYDDALELV
jgi:hypothetical protein